MLPDRIKLTPHEQNLLRGMADYFSVEYLPEVWLLAAQKFADTVALHDLHSKPEVVLTYRELYQQLKQFAAGLQSLGINGNSRLALFADNSPRWFIADQGSMMAGASNVARSSQADSQELLYILEDSDSQSLIIENKKALAQLQPEIANFNLDFIVLLSDETITEETPDKILNFSQVMAAGESYDFELIPKKRSDLATLLYTSGTTRKPKGGMLSHNNLLHQVTTLGTVIQPQAGDRVLSILPTWHTYERSAEYFFLSQGCTQFYTNKRSIKTDLQKIKPNYMVAVPRLWESIYEGVQKQFRQQPESKQKLINFFFKVSQEYILAKRVAAGLCIKKSQYSGWERFSAKIKSLLLLPVHSLGKKIVYEKVRQATGGEFKAIISGGGSLPRHLEDFFEIVEVPILVGYGLTETSPVTHARRLWGNLRYSSGLPIPGTETRIVDLTTRQELPTGQQGLVLVRGPQIMQGYYKKPEATTKAIDAEGWFDTGDLGFLTPNNNIVLTGRSKDTIVLTNGENIEPQPIEDACARSAYIDQIMLLGQDQRSLGALIVPNLEALQQWAVRENLSLEIPESHQEAKIDLNEVEEVGKLIRQELNREVKDRPGYRSDDRIGPFKLILEPFSQENGLMTQTLKIRRPVARERYRDMIDGMFN
ncbi:MAG: AMP-binding protein [Spirulinaceae cyanobacterium]